MSRFLESPPIGTVLRWVLPLVLAFWLSGCGSKAMKFYFDDLFGEGTSDIQRGAEQLAYDGAEQLREKDYEEAAKSFQQLKERYPYSKYAILAESKLGDAYFYDKKYVDAAAAYEEFVRLHPRNEVVPYVLYQLGMCHFLMFSTIDRDPEETRVAIQVLQQLVRSYPQSEYAKLGNKQLFECEKRIVAHQFYVGKFYYRREKYASAKDRLDKITRDHPAAVRELGHDKEAAKMLAECEKRIGEGEKKPSVWTRLGF